MFVAISPNQLYSTEHGGQGLCRGGEHGRCLVGLGCNKAIAEHGLVVGLDVGTLVSRPLSFWQKASLKWKIDKMDSSKVLLLMNLVLLSNEFQGCSL